MANVLLIGAGGIGSRHLQGLALMKNPTNIFVVDLSDASIAVAKERLEQVEGYDKHNYQFLNSIDNVPNDIDVAIIATGANVRRILVENLVAKKNVKYLILEKVLFQRLEDYEYVGNLLKSKNIKTWVNCPERTYPGNKLIKSLLNGARIREFSIVGSGWGLACNVVHSVDNVAFFTDCYDFEFTDNGLDKKLIDSKRKGYKEFTGTLYGKNKNCDKIAITCYEDGSLPIIVRVVADNLIVSVNMDERKMYIKEEANNWQLRTEDFPINYQSALSGRIVDEILDTGSTELVEYDNSAKTHIAVLKAFLSLQHKIGEEDKLCPIT